ncbi:hypothetical protein [Aliikangiella maris]|uniref:Uncharacterized protein n=2 Tax=Aliikangiella maris TaxID=3162458 RepID=A0ABV2BU23_9GAMM
MLPRFDERQDAERRYKKLREQALRAVELRLKSKGFSFTTITEQALSAVKIWKKSKSRPYPWDWREGRNRYQSRYPKRFEVALWHRNKLVAISLGRPTFGGSGMRLDIVEGRPHDLGDRPSVMDEILLAYEVYALLLGASHIRIMNPVNED